MSNPYFLQNEKWPKCKCTAPDFKRIIDMVICEKCSGRR